MAIETIIHCDGRTNRYANEENDDSGCPSHAKVGRAEWITVHWGKRELHFCAWDCVLSFGATIEPNEIVR